MRTKKRIITVITALVLLAALAVPLLSPTPALAAVTAFSDDFEYPDKWDDNGTTDWYITTDQEHDGLRSYKASNGDEGYLTSDDIDLSGATTASLDFWFRKDDTGDTDFTLLFYNGSSYDNILELDGEGGDDTWLHYDDVTIDLSDPSPNYKISNFRIRFDATLGSGENVWVDQLVLTVNGSPAFSDSMEFRSDKWDDNGYTLWTIQSDYVHSGSYSAEIDDDNLGNLTSDDIDLSDATAANLDFWFHKNHVDSDEFELYFYDGSSYNLIDSLDDGWGDSTWNQWNDHISIDLSDPAPNYKISNFRIRFYGESTSGADHATVDGVVLTKEVPEPGDYGDAPDTYGTLFASSGARHAPDTIWMGPAIDFELDGQPSPLADGDDLNGSVPDDEDGVTLPPSLTPGDPAASVIVDGGPSGGLLDAWIDFNGNGAFEHPGEHLWGGASAPLAPGPTNFLTFPVPPDATPGSTYARFRLSTIGSLPPTGPASDGEVEDYIVVEVLPAPGINIDKSADEASVEAGQTIHYTYDVTNDTGAGDISGVAVIDDTCTSPSYESGDTNTNDILEDGETWHYTCSYVTTMADLSVGQVDNEATATGTGPFAIQVEDKDTETVTVTSPTPLDNPELAESCGMDVVLVLDSSDSITNLDAIKTPAKAFVNAFLPDNTLIGVVEFDTNVVATLDLTNILTDTGINDAIDAIANQPDTQYTNWEAGLTEARKILENDGYSSDRDDAEHPDLIILFSDGEPTWYGYPTSLGSWSGGAEPDPEDVDSAIFAANAAKTSTAPIRILYVGVSGTTTHGQKVSGDNVHPTDAVGIGIDAITDDFSDLADILADLAGQLCPGTITIVKEVVGEAPDSDWEFSGTAPIGSFSLAAAGGSTPFSGLDAGDYTITETTKTGYTTSVSCDTGESGTNSVTIDLDPGEHITCTFTNTAQKGSITIVKDAEGGTGFEFSGDLGAFTLDGGGSQVFNDLAAGDYDVTEDPPEGWDLTNTSCEGGDGTAITDGVTIHLDPGEDITCTFTNEERIPPMAIIGIEKSATPTSAAPGDTVDYTIEYENPGDATLLNVIIVDDPDENYIASISNISDGGTYDGDKITWNIGTLNPLDSGSVTYKATLKGPSVFPPGSTNIDNTATIDSDETDPLSDDARVTVTKAAPQAPTIDLTKTADKSQAYVGDTITYTFEVENTGTVDIVSLIRTDVTGICDAPMVRGNDNPGDNDNTLEPGEVWVYTCSHLVTSGDDDPLVNHATVRGYDDQGVWDEDEDTAIVDILKAPIGVGGEAYSVNKLAILAPWIVLFAAIIAATETMLRRRRAQG